MNFMFHLSLLGLCFVCNSIYSQAYVIKADKLIDVKNEKVIEHPVVVIKGNKIMEVSQRNVFPKDAIVIDLPGHTLLPGLMDVHTHLLAGHPDYARDLYENSSVFRSLRAVQHLKTALMNGFTTIRDVCTEGAGYSDVDLSRAVDSDYVIGPTVFPSGKGIAATGRYVPMPQSQNWELSLPNGAQFATGADECTRAVREQISRGVRWVKLFADWRTSTFSFEEMKAIIDEALKYHVSVASHATSPKGIELAILAGTRSIEHGYGFNDSLIDLAVRKKVYWCPTTTVVEQRGGFPSGSTVYKMINTAFKKNLKIVCGTDIGSFPWSVNESKELEYYVTKGGLSTMAAIRTATINSAELLGIEDGNGSIEMGYMADIIAVKGNPLEDITRLQHVSFVMKSGKVYKNQVNGN